jgi:drug/metabolite transporter (DMT)-like permease
MLCCASICSKQICYPQTQVSSVPVSTTATHSSTHLKADLLLLAATVVAAAGWIFSREALAGFPPLMFMALRFTGAGLLLSVIGRTGLRRLTAQQWRQSAYVGVLFGIAMVFWIMGLKMTQHIGVGAFLCSLGLVLVPLITLFFGERSSLSVYLAIPIAIAGLACLSLDSHFNLGPAELCFLMAALFLALMFVLNSHAAAKIPALPLTAIQLLVTGLITAICSTVAEDWQFSQPLNIWGWFFASLLIATSLRFLIQTRGQGMAPPSHSAIIMTLEPVWTALLASVWFAERMTTMQLAGCGLIFAAMLVNRWPSLQLWLKSVLK